MAEEVPTPLDDHVYPVVLGKSLVVTDDEQHSDDIFVSFGYEFQPASVDKCTPGLVCVDGSNGVQVLMGSSSGAAGGVNFKGKLMEHKETDCLLTFNGSDFRLERCPFSCMQLRHVRAPTPRRRVKVQSGVSSNSSAQNAALDSKKEEDISMTATIGTAKAATAPVTRRKCTGGKRSIRKPKALSTMKKRKDRPKGSS